MNLVEQARKRLEEKEKYKEQYNKDSNLLKKLNEEHKTKVENKFLKLTDNSNIEKLTAEIEKERENINIKTNNYSKNLYKRLGINKLRKSAEDMYYKIHTPSVAISFSLEDLLEEMNKINGKKYKAELLFKDSFANELNFVIKIKKCYLNAKTYRSNLDDKFLQVYNKTRFTYSKQGSNAIFELDDCGLINFFEETTKDKTQQVVKQALINLSNKQELDNENNKNID